MMYTLSRRERNKQSAANYRKRKKQERENLEQQVESLEADVSRLTRALAQSEALQSHLLTKLSELTGKPKLYHKLACQRMAFNDRYDDVVAGRAEDPGILSILPDDLREQAIANRKQVLEAQQTPSAAKRLKVAP